MACGSVRGSASPATAEVSWKAKTDPSMVLEETALSALGTSQLLDISSGVESARDDRACRAAVHWDRLGTTRMAPTCLATSALYSEVTLAEVMSTGSGT